MGKECRRHGHGSDAEADPEIDPREKRDRILEELRRLLGRAEETARERDDELQQRNLCDSQRMPHLQR